MIVHIDSRAWLNRGFLSMGPPLTPAAERVFSVIAKTESSSDGGSA